MNDDQIINKDFHILQRNKILKDHDQFIYNEIGDRMNLSLESINFSIKNCLEIGFSSKKIINYIKSRFQKTNYLVIDISKKLLENTANEQKICLDHDQWVINEKKFDLIISNFYLHLTNNFNLLLKNINNSLNKNGFFIASIPSLNCFTEIKNCMIQADMEFYGGAYRRFNESFSIEQIKEILNINNYKIPLIEVDTLELRYEKFYTLLNDIRYLGNSNILNDRKKIFENKNYFKRVEEIYWEKFSKNKQLLLKLQIIYISGWKDDPSQQQPLKPGEAKNLLKNALE